MGFELASASTQFVVGSGTDIEPIFRLIVAVLLGAIVGLERQLSHKPAGMRTHMLVSMGAALFTVLGIFEFGLEAGRVAASIVTGIGFIGAGAIIAGNDKVHGITTAASLWAAAGIGLASGVGSYTLAVVAAILVFIILQFKRIERYFK